MRKAQQGASYLAILFGVFYLHCRKLPLQFGQLIGMIDD
jgi:hypothetical protein